MRNTLVLAFLILILTNACSKLGNANSAAVPAGVVATPTPTPTPSPTPLMTVTLKQTYDSLALAATTLGTCEVPSGTAAGTNINCTIDVPEGILHYSYISWTVDLPAGSCDRLEYLPYYYQASDVVGYNPTRGGGPIDCTLVPTPSGCFNGPAADILGLLWPTFTGLGIPVGGLSLSRDFAATGTPFSPNDSPTVTGNRYYTNELSTAKRATTFATTGTDGYVANSMHDWQFACRNPFYELNSSITIFITDTDAAIDHFDDWANY